MRAFNKIENKENEASVLGKEMYSLYDRTSMRRDTIEGAFHNTEQPNIKYEQPSIPGSPEEDFTETRPEIHHLILMPLNLISKEGNFL